MEQTISASKRYQDKHPERWKEQRRRYYGESRIRKGYLPVPRTSIPNETFNEAQARFWRWMRL